MKKFLAILAACMTMAISLISCGDKNNNYSKKESLSGSDKAASDFAEYLCGKNDAETHLKLILPESKIEELKNRDEWNDAVKYSSDQFSAILEDYQVVVKEVKKGNELTESQLEYAGNYFEKRGISGIEAEQGYEYTITVEQIERETNRKETPQTTVCVLKIDDEWKIIPMSAETLTDITKI